MDEEDEIFDLDAYLDTEEVEEDVFDLDEYLSEPTATEPEIIPASNDISFNDFNVVGEGAFDSAEEDLEDKLAAKYPHLQFDTPIMGGGYMYDELDVTDPESGEVFRWKMNTDYNAEKLGLSPEERAKKGRDDYAQFLAFANKTKFNEKGEYKNRQSERFLGEDYVVMNDEGKEVPMKVTKELTTQASNLMIMDPTVNSMEEAIEKVIDTEAGQQNITFNRDLQNEKAFKNFEYFSGVQQLAREGFNPNVSGEATGPNASKELNATIATLEKLGMPKEVVASARKEAQGSRSFLDFLESNPSSPANFNAGDPGFTRASSIAVSRVDNSEELIRKNVRAWLDGSQKWGPNDQGELITRAYNQYKAEEGKKKVSDIYLNKSKEKGVDESKVKKLTDDLLKSEDNTLTKDEAIKKAEGDLIALQAQDMISEDAKKDGEEIYKAELPFYKSEKELNELLAFKKKANESGDPAMMKEYRQKVQKFLSDGKVNLLRSPDGKFYDPNKQKQVEGVEEKNRDQINILKELLIEPKDNLDKRLVDVNTELLSIAEDLKRKGISEIINEAGFLQTAGAIMQEVVGAEGSAFEDLRKIEEWTKTGKMPALLTQLPASSTDSYLTDMYGEGATGADQLLNRWNDLIQYRSTLVLAQTLNVDPTTLNRDNALGGVGRFFEGVVEGTPEAIGMNAPLTVDKQIQLGFDVMEDAFGIKSTETDKEYLYAIEHDLWKNSGKSIPGLVRMGAEIYLTTLATGGMGLGPAALRAMTFRGLLKAGVSKGIAKNLATYTSAVMTEYVGLQGSNAMDRGLDLGPGIENPELFALTASAIRLKGAQASQKYNDAVLKVFENGTPGQRNALQYFYQVPTTASTKGGALKYTGSAVDRGVKSLSRTTLAGGQKVAGAAGGAFTISTAENVGSVLTGEKTAAQALNDVTDPAHLMELGGALLFLGLSRPDRYSKQTIERFRTEVDMLRGNNPKWNQLRRSLGMKSVSDQSEEYKQGEEAFAERVDAALELKKEEINKSDKPEAQKQREIKDLEFNANRLKLKIPLDQLSETLSNPKVLGSYKELEEAAFALSNGGFNAKNLAVIEGAAHTSMGTSPALMLELYGFDKKQAQEIVDFSYDMREIANTHFSKDLTSKNFQQYIDQSFITNKLEKQKRILEKRFKDKKLDEVSYERQTKIIDAQIEAAKQKKEQAIDNHDIERGLKEGKKISDMKKAGVDVRDMNTEQMKEFMKENSDGNWKPVEGAIGYGYQGVINGKAIALVNTEATARDKVGGTVAHEVGHFSFERKLGKEAIESRARQIAGETRDIEGAREQAKQEARDYLEKFRDALKKQGIDALVSTEMVQRPGFLNELLEGKDVSDISISELKEFINEFIQLNDTGAFNNLKTDAQRKSSESQTKKEITEAEYDAALADPAKFVDFVLSGKFDSKNIPEFIKRDQDLLSKETPTRESSIQASERTASDLAAEAKGNLDNLSLEKQKQLEKQYEIMALDALGFDPTKSNIPRSEAVSYVNQFLPGILRRYSTKRGKFSTLVNGNIRPKKQAFYGKQEKLQEALKQKRLSDKVGKEGDREFDVADPDAQRAVESAGESKSSQPVETDRQVSQFEGKEAKSKQKEILEIFEPVRNNPAELAKRSEKGLAGTPRNEVGKVAELLFDAAGDRIVNPSKNPTFSKKLINAEGEVIPKGSKEKGIGFSDSEFGNIQKYFSDNANLNRFLKTMMKYSFVPNQARINNKGEVIDISKDVRGKGLGLPKRFVDYFFETFKDPTGELLSPSGRTKGTKVQLQPGQAKRLKSKFVNPTPETLEQIKKDLLIGEDIANYDRTVHGQFAKGMATVEALKTANEATRKDLPAETPAEKQLMANLRGGTSDFAASEKMVRGLSDLIKLITKGNVVNVDKIIKNRGITGKEAGVFKTFKKPGMLAQLDQAIKNKVVDKVILKELIKMDLASPESKRVLEDIAIKDIARREGITEQEVKDRYIKNAYQKDAKELAESLGFTYKSAKDRGSEKTYKEQKPYIKKFIEKLVPEGMKFSELPKNYQGMIMMTLGLGDGSLSTSKTMKDGSPQIKGQQFRDRPLNLSEYNLKRGDYVGLLTEAFELGDVKGKGKTIDKFVDTFYYPKNWGRPGREVMKFGESNLGKTELLKDFGKKTYTKKGQEYDITLDGNKAALQRLYDVAKEVIIEAPKNQQRKALETMVDLMLSQTNRAAGGYKGLVGMDSVTPRGEKSKPTSKDVHNEHLSELFSMTKDFSLMMNRYIKGEQSIESVNKQLKRMVEDANQALITEKRRHLKDATGAAIRDYMNNLIFLGKDAKSQVPLKEGAFGEVENMLEFIRDKATSDLIKQIRNTPYEKLTEIGVMEKQRIENPKDFDGAKKNNVEVAKEATMNASEKLTDKQIREELNKRDEATRLANKINKPVKKIRVFDFDDTVGTSKNKVFAEKDGKKITLNAEEFAKRGLDLIDKGWKMDFSDFNKVTEGGKGPLFDLMKTMKEAKGERDMFILTARAPEAAPAIHKFLKEMGIDIPLENITGLGNSTGKAKADWIVGKAAEGYNDFYFADDAPQNVKAVRDALEMIDVKSQVQQARMNASEKLSGDFNRIIEEKTGIGREKVFSDIKAELRGAKARRQKFFIPPSAEDFLGLMYTTLPKGKKGDAALDFYQKNLFDPYTRAMENLSASRVNLMADFKALKKQLDVPKDLRKITESGFTNEQAVRVYMWSKEGKDIPGISKTDLKELTDLIENNPKLKAFADQIFELTKGDGYNTPGKDWAVGTITTDLIEVLNKTKRAKFLKQWKENVDIIFSKDNLNKLEAAFGKKYREAVENSLARMTSGSNRSGGTNRLSNQVLDYINNSTGAIMFFNTRSAVLQTLSAANFINWSFNNPLMAGKAFANQPQYWKDFVKLMNSEYLLDRRNGLKLNINESEIADAAKTSKNKAKAALNYILEKGYLPTKYADSFAIASGGAMFYRNRINDLVKKGMDIKEAEAQAMKEFRQISEMSQQSSDPSKISQQQSSDLGRIVLQFANTPMQYARIQKRAVQDLINGRGDPKVHVSKLAYYGFLQNLMFNALQQGMFALGFGDDFSDEEKEKKTVDTINGMLDSSLRGIGLAGVTVGVLKNLILDVYRRSGRSRPEYVDAYYKLLEFSPAIKSKLSKIKGAAYPFDSKKRRKEVFDKGFSLDNPAYESLAKVITAITNVPLDRAYLKNENLKHASQDDTETWMAIANFLGWPTWQLEPRKSKGKKVKPKLKYNTKAKSYEDEADKPKTLNEQLDELFGT